MQVEENYQVLEIRTNTASVVFSLIDDFTGERPSGDITVSISGMSRTPVKNKSGYYIFLNLPDGEYNFIIKGGEYWGGEKIVSVKRSDAVSIQETVNLIPLPSYSFPNGATLLRGTVLEKGTEKLLSGVNVRLKIKGKDKLVNTTVKGEFVIYLPALKVNMIKKVNGSYFVKGDNDDIEMSAVFSKSGYVEETDKGIKLEVGRQITITKYLRKGGV